MTCPEYANAFGAFSIDQISRLGGTLRTIVVMLRPGLKIALVHDYLIQDGGAERVLDALQSLFPDAPTFTLLADPKHPQTKGTIRTSFLQSWPFAIRLYQWYLPFMPVAIEHLDLTGYDLVISSSSSFAKGIIVPPGTIHLCYCHTPTRFLWQDRIGYLNDVPAPRLMRTVLPHILHSLRIWDRLAAERPDHMLTNSTISKDRIRRYYNREAEIIYPPVDIQKIPLSTNPGTYWLAGGRLVGYKRFDLVVKAFAKLNLPLKIFGTGPEEKKLRAIAGKNTEFLGYIRDEEKIRLYQDAIGFFYPQVEDFGITAIEAMASGKPVIAYNKGGAAETVIDGVTGIHIAQQSWEAIGNAVIRFDASRFDPATIRRHAEHFSIQRFSQALETAIEQTLARS